MSDEYVHTHAISVDLAQRRIVAAREELRDIIADVKSDGRLTDQDIRDIRQCASDLAGYCSVVAHNDEELVRAVHISSQAAVFEFRACTSGHEISAVQFEGQEVELRASVTSYVTATPAWLQAMSISGAANIEPAMVELLSYPQELLRRADLDLSLDVEYYASYRKARGAIYLGGSDNSGPTESILEALRRLNPEDDWQLLVDGPSLDVLWDACVVVDEGSFNAHLVRALELHREYWDRDDESRRDPTGFIAWRLLPILHLAQARGIGVKVESPYLPAALRS